MGKRAGLAVRDDNDNGGAAHERRVCVWVQTLDGYCVDAMLELSVVLCDEAASSTQVRLNHASVSKLRETPKRNCHAKPLLCGVTTPRAACYYQPRAVLDLGVAHTCVRGSGAGSSCVTTLAVFVRVFNPSPVAFPFPFTCIAQS